MPLFMAFLHKDPPRQPPRFWWRGGGEGGKLLLEAGAEAFFGHFFGNKVTFGSSPLSYTACLILPSANSNSR